MIRDKLYQVGIDAYKNLSRYCTLNVMQVKVETTKVCNLRCPGCRRRYSASISTEPGPVHLTPGALWRIVATTNMQVVRFEGDGEPTCNPHFRELVEMCSRLGIRSAMTSNATLLTPAYVRFLERHGMSRIHVSFDGANKDTFEKLRLGADFEKVLYNCTLIGKSKIQLFMNVLLSTPEVLEQLPKYVLLAKRAGATGVHLMKYQAENLNGFQGPNLTDYQEPIKAFAQEARALGLAYVGTVTERPTYTDCDDPYTCPYVLLNDDVYPCSYMANLRRTEVYCDRVIKVPFMNYRMGNLRDNWMKSLWYSSDWQHLRQLLRDTSYRKGTTTTLEQLLELKTHMADTDRFAHCIGCLCRWGESGI